MSIFTPGRRWQPPFLPFKREPPGRRLLASVEEIVNGPLWGCRMCGNCLLQETAFICPTECPKGIRNVLCVTGDSPVLAPQPRGRMDINDLDAIQMLWDLRRMRDEGRYLDGREIKYPPKFFLGAAASPFSSAPKFQTLREPRRLTPGRNSSRPTWSTILNTWKSGLMNSPNATSLIKSTPWWALLHSRV